MVNTGDTLNDMIRIYINGNVTVEAACVQAYYKRADACYVKKGSIITLGYASSLDSNIYFIGLSWLFNNERYKVLATAVANQKFSVQITQLYNTYDSLTEDQQRKTILLIGNAVWINQHIVGIFMNTTADSTQTRFGYTRFSDKTKVEYVWNKSNHLTFYDQTDDTNSSLMRLVLTF